MLIAHKVRNICVFFFAFLIPQCFNKDPMTNELAKAVIQTANNNYNLSFGWSEIVECWTEQEILEELKEQEIDTKEAAINHFTQIAEIRTEYAEEIQSTAW